jgi:hypothetical protein
MLAHERRRALNAALGVARRLRDRDDRLAAMSREPHAVRWPRRGCGDRSRAG